MKLTEKVFRHIKRNYKPIDPESFSHSQFAFNNQLCFDNAVQAYRAGRANKVWLVWAGTHNGMIHFINSNDGVFFDETWVDTERPAPYYIIREVMPWELDSIKDLFVSVRYDLVNTCGNWLDMWRYKRNPNSTI
tara:strand:+ start:121258 stop:121659 length:402 start_codon:yes stop_codon:yes gene_type:complete